VGRNLNPCSEARSSETIDGDGAVKAAVPLQSDGGERPATEIRTFLIADVRGYTRFTVEHGDEAAARLAARFADIVEETVTAREGQVVELRGDEALAVFSSPRAALRGATDLQKRFAEERQGSTPFEVGIGLDAGEAIPVKGGFRGAALNLAARLCSLAGRGEVLASDVLVHLARKIEGLEYVERGFVQLKGFTEPVKVIEVRPSSVADTPADGSSGRHSTVEDEIAGDTAPIQHLPIGGFLGSLPASTLVGRDEDVQHILTAIEAVMDGDGRLIMLAGEPGVGKTRLAQEATLTVRNRGFMVVAGTCYESEQGTPFYPFLEALSQAYDAAPPSIQTAVRRQWPSLGKLLPTQSIPVPAGAWSTQEEQQRLFWAVTGFLQAIAERMPVALLLDDLQWADGSTLSLLQHLARHTRSRRILLLGNYRDVEIDRRHPLEAVLLDLSRQQILERIAVHRLPVEGTAALLAHSLGMQDTSQEFAALLHSHTEGNPFFVQEVLRSLVERGDVYRENGHWSRRALEQIEVPPSVRAVVGQRLSHLSEEAQTLLQEASVLGQTFVFDDLQQVDGRSEAEIERALEDAVAAGLVREAGNDTYAFNHNLTQQSLYAELSSRRRRRLHLAAGDTLERQSPVVRERRVAETALHFQKAGAPERALPYAMLVGDRAAAAFAHEDAARHYRTALDLAKQTGDRSREAEAYEKMGGLLTATIRYREALEMLEPAARLFEAVRDRESEGRVNAQIGRVYYSIASAQEGIARLEPAMASLAGEDSPHVLAGLTSVLGKLYFVRGRYQEALACAERGAELARRAAQGGVLAESQITRGSALVQLGRWHSGLQALEEAVVIADSASDVYSVCRALQGAAAVYLVQGDFDRHRRTMERALEVAERMHNQRQIAAATFGLFVNAFVRGNWTEAHQYADRVLDVMGALGATWHSAFHLVGLAALAVAEGDDDTADRYLVECLDVSGPTGDAQTFQGAQEVLAQKDLQSGHASRARRRLESLLDQSEIEQDSEGRISTAGTPLPGYLTGHGTYHATGLLPLLGWAYVAMGDTAAVDSLTVAGIEQAAAEGLRLSLAQWTGLKGASLARQEQWSESEAAFDDALALCRGISYPYGEGRLLYEVGRMWGSRGEPERARNTFERALSIFRQLGARPYTALTEEALGKG
jgi:class 3 adenylate cyclase/tetratricopeptide (TPR) repeat protein